MTQLLIGSPSTTAMPKGAERHTKSIDQNDRGFTDALEGKPSRRNTPKDEAPEDTHVSRLSPKLEGYLSGLEELAAETITAEEPPAVPVDETLELEEAEVPVAIVAPDVEAVEPGYVALDEIPDAPLPIKYSKRDPESVPADELDLAIDAKAPPVEAEGQDALTNNIQAARTPEANAVTASIALTGQPRPAAELQGPQSSRTNRPGPTQNQERLSGETRQGDVPARAVAAPSDTGKFTPIGEAMRSTAPEGNSRPASPGPDPVGSRVNVLGFTAALAPSSPISQPLTSTAAGLVSVMETDPTWRAAATEGTVATAVRAGTSSGGVNTLKIQLHPIELGVVTARLSTTGSQLSVEIQVESGEAYKKLTTDSEAILKALRSIGYDIEKVSIQQAPNPTPGTPQASPGRDQFLANQQAQDGNDAKGRSNQQGGSPQESERSAHGSGEMSADLAGSSLYI
jgi:flagellar hook-length control protein FliK